LHLCAAIETCVEKNEKKNFILTCSLPNSLADNLSIAIALPTALAVHTETPISAV